MADNSTSFTYIGESSWWQLREKFKSKVPATVNVDYVTLTLGMTEGSARSNIIAPLKKIGIIDEKGVPTDLAYDWRDDTKYASMCQKIIDECYPQTLKDSYQGQNPDIGALTNWFMRTLRVGKSAADKYAKFYYLLLRADPTEQNAKPKSPPSPPSKAKVTPKKRGTDTSKSEFEPISQDDKEGEPQQKDKGNSFNFSAIPQLHINIQLHISPETNAEQIDKIFESMARHLRSFAEQSK